MTQLNSKEKVIDFLKFEGYSTIDQSEIVILEKDGLNIVTAFIGNQIEFLVDLCGVNELNGDLLEIYEKVLDENTKILPNCFGIDSDDVENKRLVLVDSLAIGNLDPNELLLTLDSFFVNVIGAFDLLESHIKK